MECMAACCWCLMNASRITSVKNNPNLNHLILGQWLLKIFNHYFFVLYYLANSFRHSVISFRIFSIFFESFVIGVGIGIVDYDYWRCPSSRYSLLWCCLRIVKCNLSIIFLSNLIFETHIMSLTRGEAYGVLELPIGMRKFAASNFLIEL